MNTNSARAWVVSALLTLPLLATGCKGVGGSNLGSTSPGSTSTPSTSTPPVSTPTTPIPELALWESHMLSHGHQHCDELIAMKDGPIDPPLGATYYDATRVYYQIASYTGQTEYFNNCADAARYVYGDRYAAAGAYQVPGYWNFTTGLRMDYERTGRQSSKDTVIGLSQNMYGADTTPIEWTANVANMRETAYAIMAFINAEKLGAPKRDRRKAFVDQAYGHIPQFIDPSLWGKSQISPFMSGLTAHALIMDWEETHDPRAVPALRSLANYLWDNAWRATEEGMLYQMNPLEAQGLSTQGAPDLNLLIAPMYAFLYEQTGETIFRDRGDMLFAGGVRHAYLDGAKQFDQNYIYSFDYVKRRSSR